MNCLNCPSAFLNTAWESCYGCINSGGGRRNPALGIVMARKEISAFQVINGKNFVM